MEQKTKFDNLLQDLIANKNVNNVYLSKSMYSQILNEVETAKSKMYYKSPLDYRRLRRYDVLHEGKDSKLISPLKEDSKIKYFVSSDQLFDIIHNSHLTMGHCGRNKLLKKMNEKYKNVTAESIMLYLSLCNACQQNPKRKWREIANKKEKIHKIISKKKFTNRITIKKADLLEEAMFSWLQKKKKLSIPISTSELCEKAQKLSTEVECDSEFRASAVWLKNFKSDHKNFSSNEKLLKANTNQQSNSPCSSNVPDGLNMDYEISHIKMEEAEEYKDEASPINVIYPSHEESISNLVVKTENDVMQDADEDLSTIQQSSNDRSSSLPNITTILTQSYTAENVLKNQTSQDVSDEFDLFGKSIAMQLRQLPIHHALTCQEKLHNVIVQYRLSLMQSNPEKN